jgi:serine/threonine protein kinase
VELLKDFSNPNIAEVLFAFREDQPPRLSLVFEFHPTDLRKLLFDSNSKFKAPKKTVETFPGSILDHWMWIGVLGIFDAVAAIHDPLSCITTIPQNAKSRVVAGHFDIKPANIIIDDNGRFLLTDFGQAYFKTIENGQETNLTVYPGTLDYTPPSSYSRRRVINGQIPSPGDWWSREYDVWSLGCVSVEVLTFIVDGADAPGKFYQERLNEDPQRLGTFWMTTETGELVLKQSVQDRLSGLYQAAHGDQYLIRVVEQIKKMFPLQRSEAMAVKDCHQKLSASVEVDRYLFMGLNDELIAGDHTWACLKDLRTSFSTGRVSALRCFLYLWRNPARQRFTLTLEFNGSDKQTIVKPSSTNARADEIIPLAFFKPDTIFDQNLLRTDGPFLECAFRNMHDGITFQFARRDNYNHFLGAFTYQYVVPGSEFRFRSCSLESAEWTSKRTWSSTEGHLQFWMKLEPEIYFDRYQKKRAPVVPAINLPRSQRLELPQSPRGEDSSSTTSSSISKQYTKDSTSVIPHFRLALYLCGQPNRALVIFSITYDAFDITFDKPSKGHPRMVLKKRSGKDFLAAVIERPISAGMSNGSVPSYTVDDCPGIPMSEQGLSDLMKEELRTVKIEFCNESGEFFHLSSMLAISDVYGCRPETV